MEVLERVGTPEQKEKWLVPLLNGEIRSAYAMTEPDISSSDPTQLQTTATLEGDEWVINGHKVMTSNGIRANFATQDVSAEPLGACSWLLRVILGVSA